MLFSADPTGLESPKLWLLLRGGLGDGFRKHRQHSDHVHLMQDDSRPVDDGAG